MALIRCDFSSDALGLSTSMTVVLPQATSSRIGMAGAAAGGDAPVLYLRHGLSDDDTIWLRRTSIERDVAPLGLAVVMPQAGRSFYTDEVHGNRCWTFLSAELPAVVRSFFRISGRRETPSSPGCRWGATARSSGRCGTRTGSPPRLYVGCGTEDRLIAHNERFGATARARGFAVTDDLRPGGHEWGLWDAMIQDVLRWLPLRVATAAA